MSFVVSASYSFWSIILNPVIKRPRWLAPLFSFFMALSGCSAPQFHPVHPLSHAPYIADHGFVMPDGYVLPFTRYEVDEPRAVVVALHGFNDYRRSFEAFCAAMQAQEIACYAYDQRGFGETELHGFWPQPGQLQRDFHQILQLLSQRYPSVPLYAAGESMGGAVIITATADVPATDVLSGAVLLAPAVWARHTQPWYQRWALWLAVHTFPGWQPTGEGLGIQATDNIEALRKMGRDPLVIKATRIDAIYGLNNLMDNALASAGRVPVPALVLYGKRDEVIPKAPTCLMLDAMLTEGVDVSVRLYDEGYHMLTRDLQAARVFEDSAEWMLRGQRDTNSSTLVKRYCAG